jgi:hypothetical protein
MGVAHIAAPAMGSPAGLSAAASPPPPVGTAAKPKDAIRDVTKRVRGTSDESTKQP